MLGKFIESLYTKVFVNVVVKGVHTLVYIEVVSKKSVVDSAQDSFETTGMNDEMYTFISEYTAQSPYYYISTVDSSMEQGAVYSCSKDDFALFANTDETAHKCYNDKWIYYSPKTDIEALKQRYAQVGLDFIFSPFVVLADFFKDKIESHFAMFILVQNSNITLSVFDNATLLYSSYINNTQKEKDKKSEDLQMEDESELDFSLDDGLGIDLDSVNLDEIDVDDELESLDDFGNIEDLDSVDELDDFSSSQDLEEELIDEANELESADNLSEERVEDVSFNEDYTRFLLIQSAIDEFYKDDKYNSKFIENVYVADDAGVSSDFKKYLEEEMFLNVYVRKIDLLSELCHLSKMELQDEV